MCVCVFIFIIIFDYFGTYRLGAEDDGRGMLAGATRAVGPLLLLRAWMSHKYKIFAAVD